MNIWQQLYILEWTYESATVCWRRQNVKAVKKCITLRFLPQQQRNHFTNSESQERMKNEFNNVGAWNWVSLRTENVTNQTGQLLTVSWSLWAGNWVLFLIIRKWELEFHIGGIGLKMYVCVEFSSSLRKKTNCLIYVDFYLHHSDGTKII